MTGVVFAVLACVLAAVAGRAATPRPTKLVFILTDNQGAWTLGCYGHPDIRTPHIDRLAAEGVCFTRALSSNPVCSPTRATFLTALSHLGLGDRMPAKPRSPGRDFSVAWRGASAPGDNTDFYEMEDTRAIRTADWKLVARFPDGPYERYDMRKDPRERFNRYGQPGVAAKRSELATRLNTFFSTYSDPQYDRWKGGRSMSRPSR